MSVVIEDKLHKNHSNSICSRAGLVSVVLIFVTLFLPFFIVTQTHSKFKSFKLLIIWFRLLGRYQGILRATESEASE